MRKLARSLPGMQEVPALKELNDIRQHTGHDLSVYDRKEFNERANALTLSKYTPDEIEDAYLQLHLIADAGGSDAPQWRFKQSSAERGQNVGKYDIERILGEEGKQALDNLRSREMSAISMLEDNELLPVQTNQSFLDDTSKALSRFITSNAIGSTKLGNSGIRTKKKQNDPELLNFAVQNWDDLSSGYDRQSRDYIANQPVEFGHYIPANKGGADERYNGRMQAMSANRAMGDRLGVAGALSAVNGQYKELATRFAGDNLSSFIYNNGAGKDFGISYE